MEELVIFDMHLNLNFSWITDGLDVDAQNSAITSAVRSAAHEFGLSETISLREALNEPNCEHQDDLAVTPECGTRSLLVDGSTIEDIALDPAERSGKVEARIIPLLKSTGTLAQLESCIFQSLISAMSMSPGYDFVLF
ncbi:unnamed protein product [Allacma fusca]|uniref:Uncharacterized protein n=1 Tax=Allacma fusca TaxID=39272 RepID=A0A8J2LCY3_9HEXA|nr:unnamed protein product [Allacma fusca]